VHPILFEIGSFQLRYYGLMYALGILAVYLLGQRDLAWAKVGVDNDGLFNLIIYTFVGAIVGARVYYVLFNLDYYRSQDLPWWEFVALWHGGLAIHGGLITGPLTLYLVSQYQKLPFARLADLFAPYLLLAQAIGRIGNLMNGDAHGVPTDLPWGIVFHYGPASREFPGIALHPVMLYEMVLNLIGFGLLYSIRKKGLKPGFVTAAYMIAYGVIRFVVSFFRADDLYFWGIRAPHVASILLVGLGLGLIFGLKLHKPDLEKKKKEQQFLPKRQWK